MTIHTIAAWGGIAGMVIAILWIAFADARGVNAALNEGANEISNSDHDAPLIHVGERDHG